MYAYGEKEFVVDAYTRRIFSYLGLINEKDSYNKIKKLFEDNFSGDVNDYQEYHALIRIVKNLTGFSYFSCVFR